MSKKKENRRAWERRSQGQTFHPSKRPRKYQSRSKYQFGKGSGAANIQVGLGDRLEGEMAPEKADGAT